MKLWYFTQCNEKNINNEIFNEYFGYQSPSFLAEDFLIPEIPENENPIKIIDVVEKTEYYVYEFRK